MPRPGPTVTRSLGAAVSARPSPHSAAVQPRVVPTAAPSPEFRQHHVVQPPQIDPRVYRPGWLVTGQLQRLAEAGLIGRDEMESAHRWRRWAEIIGPKQTQPWDVRCDRSLVPNDIAMLRRVDAATALREVAQGIGELRVRIIEAVVIRDLPWAELAKLLRCSDKTARVRAAEALTALTLHFQGASVPPVPLPRFRNEPGAL